MKLPKLHTVQEIATLIEGQVIGNPETIVTGINEIHKVVAGDLSFVDHPKYYEKCLQSAASVVMINAEVACPSGKALILVKEPIASYNKLVKHFLQSKVNASWIGANVEVDDSAIIGAGVYIGNDVRIGAHSIIHPNVTIYDRTEIGDKVIIHAGAVIGNDAYYYKRYEDRYEKLLSSGRTIIENDVEIGPACTIAKGVTGDTIIGEGTKLDSQVHIGHGVVIGKRCLLAAQVGVAGKTTIEDEVILWGQVGVSKDLTIGKKAVVLAQSGVSKSLPSAKTYFGSPAEEVHQAFRKEAKLRLLAK